MRFPRRSWCGMRRQMPLAVPTSRPPEPYNGKQPMRQLGDPFSPSTSVPERRPQRLPRRPCVNMRASTKPKQSPRPKTPIIMAISACRPSRFTKRLTLPRHPSAALTSRSMLVKDIKPIGKTAVRFEADRGEESAHFPFVAAGSSDGPSAYCMQHARLGTQRRHVRRAGLPQVSYEHLKPNSS